MTEGRPVIAGRPLFYREDRMEVKKFFAEFISIAIILGLFVVALAVTGQ